MAKQKTGGRLSFLLFLLVLGIVLFGGKAAYDAVIQPLLYPKKYAEYVEQYAEKYHIEENLLYAVIRTESGFDPDSVSSANAYGLTQITEDTFDWLMMKTGERYDFSDLFIPELSVKYGALFLSILTEEYEATETAIAAYHAGMGNVSSWLQNPAYSDDGVHLKTIPISDTAHYVNKVTAAMEKYNTIYASE